ncbi:hypothetical protein IFM12276_40730 [Nocardia sputorum]|uniref:Uncharacterized protein n=2 Tax=Nocardiaceae TaxID=85025 RepID=A0ABN6U7D4_9NOCA|nr:hypothetical protein IFM12276_40730 [Nocardia sputorum]
MGSRLTAARSRISAAGQFRAGGDVELLQADLLFELAATDATGDRLGFPAGDLVMAQDLQELNMPEIAGAGLGKSGVQGRQLQRPQRLLKGGFDNHADTSSPRSSAPRSIVLATGR